MLRDDVFAAPQATASAAEASAAAAAAGEAAAVLAERALTSLRADGRALRRFSEVGGAAAPPTVGDEGDCDFGSPLILVLFNVACGVPAHSSSPSGAQRPWARA